MSDERGQADGRVDGHAESTRASGCPDGGAGGWSSQGRGLKILLFASVAIVIFAVVRCSMELAPLTPDIENISVLRPSIDVPDGILPAPPDSIAVVAARQLARTLAAASGVDAVVVESVGEAGDATATFSLSSSEGNIIVVLEITDARSQVLSRAESEGPPEHLYAILGIAARRAAAEIWPTVAATEDGRR